MSLVYFLIYHSFSQELMSLRNSGIRYVLTHIHMHKQYLREQSKKWTHKENMKILILGLIWYLYFLSISEFYFIFTTIPFLSVNLLNAWFYLCILFNYLFIAIYLIMNRSMFHVKAYSVHTCMLIHVIYWKLINYILWFN